MPTPPTPGDRDDRHDRHDRDEREGRDACYVFVYGTLRRGFGNHRCLEGAAFVGEARTVQRYALYIADLPYLGRTPAWTPIAGEVYAVSPAQLARLDRLEGHPDWYRRSLERVTVTAVADGGGPHPREARELRAWIYFSLAPEGLLSASGDFLDHRTPPLRRAQARDATEWPAVADPWTDARGERRGEGRGT